MSGTIGAVSARSVVGYTMRPDETDRPERPALASQMHHEQSCLQSSARPMLDPNIVNHTDVNFDIDTDLPEKSAPMMNSDLIFVDWEDAIRREVLRNRSMGYRYRSSREINDQLLSPEHANLSDAGIFLYQVRSESLPQCNMVMDVEYHYETFNGLSVYYGGDLYDTEDTDEFDPDVQEGIDFIIYTHSRPDGGEARGVDMVDMVYR